MSFFNQTTGHDTRSLADKLRAELQAIEKQEEEQKRKAEIPSFIRPKEEPKIVTTPASNSAGSFVWPDKFTEYQRMIIGKGIQDARKLAKLTQEGLARLTGLSAAYISQVETGRAATIDKDMIKKIGLPMKEDFNDLVMDACTAPVSHKEQKQVIQAVNSGVEIEQDQTYRIKTSDFCFVCSFDSKNYSITMEKKDGDDCLLFEGVKSDDSVFLNALDALLKLIKKHL